ncbi:flavin reductase family protein [Clostridium oceanicum]|uniref:Flavin reductase n=1 Tax=Clostridium oceanicum TaxID=1543 RepID=A0ABP3ULM4_9CLOT
MSVNYTQNMEEAIKSISTRGAFLTSKADGKVNTMTIGWGSIGYSWRKPIFTALIRESRFTKHFVDKSNEFTISVPLDDNMKKELAFCGSKSGRDYDKIKECSLKLKEGNKVETPVISDCKMHYECKVLYKQEMDLNLLDEDVKNQAYKDGDIHTIYYAEIVDCYSL